MNIQSIVSSALQIIVNSPPWCLLLLKISAILGVAWLMHLALSKANPRWRVLLWRTTAVGLFALPAIAWMLPAMQIHFQPLPEKMVTANETPVAHNNQISAAAAGISKTDPNGIRENHSSRMQPNLAVFDAKPANQSNSPLSDLSAQTIITPTETIFRLITAQTILLFVWLSGMAILSVRFFLGYRRVVQISRSAKQTPEWIRGECNRVADKIACRSRVDVMQSEEILSPFLCGLQNARLLLPVRMCQVLYRSDLPSIFAHELTHVRHRDLLWNAFLHTISILLWFHPLAWRLRKSHLTACELVCDAVSAGYVGDVNQYCQTLARVAVATYESHPAAGLAMAKLSTISRRLKALKTHVFHLPLRRRNAILFGIALLLVVSILGVMKFAFAEPTVADPISAANKNDAKPVETLSVSLIQEERNSKYESRGHLLLSTIHELNTIEDEGMCYLNLPSAMLQWSQHEQGKSGYLYFDAWNGPHPFWEFAPSSNKDFKDFDGQPLRAKFYRANSPNREVIFGIVDSQNAIQVKVGQIVLARTVKDPNTIYILKIDKQSPNKEELSIKYVVIDANSVVKESKVAKEEVFAKNNESNAILLSAFGTVVDEAGKPISGATVYLREWSTYRVSENRYDKNPKDILATTRTDTKGAYSFKNIPAKPFNEQSTREIPWDVVVMARGHALAWRHLDMPKQPDPISFQLMPEARITGNVADEKGLPIEGVEVSIFNIMPLDSEEWGGNMSKPGIFDLQRSQLAPTAKSDASGNITIEGLPCDVRLTVILDHENYRNEYIYVATTNRPQPDIESRESNKDGKLLVKPKMVFLGNFSLELKPPLPQIVGRVTAADTGKPLPGFRIDATWKSYNIADISDESGRFVLKGANLPQYRIILTPPEKTDYLGKLEQIEIPKDNKEVEINIQLPRGQVISGQVVAEDTGKGVAGVTVSFVNELRMDKVPTGTFLASHEKTDSEGNFKIVVPSGEKKLRITGPVRGYDIPSYNEVFKDDDPRFSKEIDVQPGIAIPKVNFIVSTITPPDEPPLRRQPKEKTTTIFRKIEGKVIDKEGKPVAGAEVGMLDWFYNPEDESRIVRSDEEGRFSLLVSIRTNPDGLNDEAITARHQDRKLSGRVSIPYYSKKGTEDQLLEIPLSPTGVVTGQVLEGETPIANADIYIEEIRDTIERKASRWAGITKTNDKGEFTFPLVEAGKEYQISVIYIEGYAKVYDNNSVQRFVMKPGETVELKPFKFLKADMSVAGIVVDPDGKPVEGVIVSAKQRSGMPTEYASNRKPTGKDGRFFISHLPNVPLSLMVFIQPSGAGGQVIKVLTTIKAEPGDQNIRITLNRN